MSEKSGSVGKVILGSAVAAAILVPVGYVGFDFMRKELRDSHTETRSVVMELQTATVEELRASAQKTAEALKQARPGGSAGNEVLASEMSALKRATEDILSEQKSINEGLKRLLAEETAAANSAASGTEEIQATYSEAIYFGIGKSSGADVDKRIAAILPDIRKHLTKGACEIDITGFADTLGNDLNNLKLSRERADYVAAKIRASGIDVSSVEAWGERRLKTITYDGVRNENNRRAEIEMHCGKKPAKPAAGS